MCLNLAILGGCLGNGREAQFHCVYRYNMSCTNKDILEIMQAGLHFICIVLCNAVRFIDAEMHVK